MTTSQTLSQTCRSVAVVARRLGDLLASAPDLSGLAHRSEWTVQEVGAHLVAVAGFFTELANGTPSFLVSMEPDYVRSVAERSMADIAESDPVKLSRLLVDSFEEFLDVAAERSGDDPVTFHGGMPYHLAGAAGVALGEMILHGYDMAAGLGAPWPIEPADAALVVGAYSPVFALTVHPEKAKGLSAAVEIDLRGFGAVTVRFTDGIFGLEEAGGPVDATLSADPVAFLLVGSGRLTRYEATALGLWRTGGDRPALALGFPDLFVFP
ncbi:MAG TPA: maleylpyruvate isomerase N-terminal domain-containing protein [Acidimicrobiia bacterium]|nr:maleylpyruvate isomerase N-terminal domain-containing protein [Acidimicrobiia bacterium]